MPSSRKSSQPKGWRQILLALSHLGRHIYTHVGFPGGTTGEEPTCHCRRHKRCEFHPWVGRIHRSRERQPTAVFLPGESHGQGSLVGHSLWGHKESDTTEWLTHTRYIQLLSLNPETKSHFTHECKQYFQLFSYALNFHGRHLTV